MRFFILLAILVKSVYNEESDGNVQGRYHFNHPPSIESYNPIPVAVIFENSDVKEKSINEPEDIPIDSTTTEKEDIEITTNVPLKVNLKTKPSEPEPPTKERTVDYFQQIPVQVIYDTEPTILYRPTTEPNKDTKPLRRVKQRRLYRTKPTTQKENIIEVSTEKYEPEVISETVKPYVPAKPTDIKPKATRQRDPAIPVIESVKVSTESNKPKVISETVKPYVPAKLTDIKPKATIQRDPAVPVIESVKVSTESNKPEVINETVKPYVPVKPIDIKPKATRQRDPVVPVIESVKISTESNKPEVISKTMKPYVPVKPTDIKPKATRQRDPVVPIIESQNYVYSHNGNFRYSYEGGDGTRAFSEGQLKQIEDDAGEAVIGGFSYTDKDGNDFSLSYTADENGYRPVGAHLPTPPPIPPAIARALEYLATATSPKPVTKPGDEYHEQWAE